jgi:hypothetical protein
MARRDSRIAVLAALLAGACGGASRGAPPVTPATAQPGEGAATAPARGDPPPAPPATPDPAAPPTAPVTAESDDDRLIAGVRRAAGERVAPDALEARVGQKPLVNTHKGPSLAVLRRVHLVPDPAHGDELLDLASATAVMYWRRPIDGEDPHFVGIQIRKDGSHAVFFAILLPP